MAGFSAARARHPRPGTPLPAPVSPIHPIRVMRPHPRGGELGDMDKRRNPSGTRSACAGAAREVDMKSKSVVAARILLGLVFFVFGVNGLLQLSPPSPMPERAAAFVAGLAGSGYLFPLLHATYVIAGAALLSGCFVPLALVLLAPAIVNIFAVHLFLAPAGLPLATVVSALELFLAWSYRESFRPLFRARGGAAPAPVSPPRNSVAAQAH